ncbi:MAG TPA: RidA family protein [Alphaproteobacteria bacterium]|nr:RidA family protein [Alphaproteobacteria bacterium]
MRRHVIKTASAPTPLANYCQGIAAGDVIYAAGQIASDFKTGVAPEVLVDPAFPYYGSEIQRQTRYILDNLSTTFKAAGCDLKDVVKAQVFLTDLDDFFYFDQIWKQYFPAPPPRTTIGISALLVPGCLVEIDLVAVKPGVPRKVIATKAAPTPLAHYCQGIVVGDTVYAAGQIASDYKTGVAPEARVDPAFPYYGSEIQRQARYILENFRATFKAAGCELKDVVKAQVFLTDLADFFHFDQIWKQYFPAPPPRTTIGIGGLLVPGCKVEIDLVAVKPNVARKVITTKTAPTPLAHYCQGIVVGSTVYAAGQIASDYKTGVAPEARVDPAFPHYGSEIERQTRTILDNLAATFKAAGCGLNDVVKAQVFMTDLDDFFAFDQVWKEYFPAPPPRTTIGIGGLLVPGCKVEIDLIAVKR